MRVERGKLKGRVVESVMDVRQRVLIVARVTTILKHSVVKGDRNRVVSDVTGS